MKTALRFHLSPIKMAKIKKTMTTNVDEPAAIGESLFTVSGIANWQGHCGNQC